MKLAHINWHKLAYKFCTLQPKYIVHAISGLAFMNGDWEKISTYMMLDLINTIRVPKRGFRGGVALKKLKMF